MRRQPIHFSCALLAMLIASSAQALADDPEIPASRPIAIRPAGAPLVMVYLPEPSLTVVGADSPVFALYDDGTVIFRSVKRGENDRPSSRSGYRAVRLDEEAVAELRRKLAIDTMKRRGEQGDDGGEAVKIVLRDGEGVYCLRAYQLTKPEAAAASAMLLFDHPDAIAWMPDEVEVLLWPAEAPRGEPIAWPDKWPKLDRAVRWTRTVHSPDHEKTAVVDGFSLPLDMSQVSRLRAILRETKHTRPISIDGKLFSASYRIPFPGERDFVANP